MAEIAELQRGVYEPLPIGDEQLLGLLVVQGLLIRSVQVAERNCGELVGGGAILRPWDQFGQYAPMPFDVSWRVIEPVRFALLDQRLVAMGARWPPLMLGIMRRAVERSHALALNVAIHSLKHTELRLLVLFWHLADRFGRVTPEGTIVPLRLSHSDIAELIGSRRPSVSSRLAILGRERVIERRADRTWLLRGEPPAQVRDVRARAHALQSIAASTTGPRSGQLGVGPSSRPGSAVAAAAQSHSERRAASLRPGEIAQNAHSGGAGAPDLRVPGRDFGQRRLTRRSEATDTR